MDSQQQHQQPQPHQQQQSPHFIPIHGERVISPSGGVMIRHAVNKNNNTNSNAMNATAVLGISIPAPNVNHMSPPVPVSVPVPVSEAVSASVSVPAIQVAAALPNPLVNMVQDVIFNMILNVPALRTKLQVILDNPSLIGDEIRKVHDELQSKLTPQELQQLNSYACQDTSRRTIGTVMQTAFANIMADGKIDMSDAPHFLTLIHDCITLFSAEAEAAGAAVALNSNTVIVFLHFVLKCILILTLDGPEEAAALVMLDGSFKLVKLTVLPLIAGKKWCCFS